MDKKTKVVSNLIWRFFERFGAQAVNIVVGILLARELGPGPAGDIAIVMAVITILKVFADSGMANALIQKKDPDDLDFSSVFFFNLGFSLILYAGLFLAAPAIARHYQDMSYVPVLRVLGLLVVVSGLYNVQQAYVAKTLQFKRFFFATLGGTLVSCALSIWMAYHGFGIWSLVALHLSNFTINTAILWATIDWRPKRMFSFQRLRALLSYGWKLLAASFLDTVYLQLYPLLIGSRFPKAELGQFDKGRNWPDQITQSINASIDGVLLPVLSAEQDDKARVREMTRRAIKTSSYVMMPLMAGLAVCASPLVHLLLGEQWMPCVPYMQIFCVIYAFYPLHTANLNAIKAMGRSDVFLILEIVKKALETGVLLFTLRYGVLAMAVGQLCSSIAAQVINAWPNRKLLDYPYLRQIGDMLPAILLSAGMGAAVWTVTRLGLSDLATLLIQVPLGGAIYVLLSWALGLDSFTFLLSTAKTMLRRKAGGEDHD
ncbi:MAG: lipopolysaccharide biosynthesis protein [Oscillospiraceae bacterium]|nr:lipopolysaccharide biosynthesis protein [Oscillospiraceae bacterium]